MKTFISLTLAACAFASPALSFAQSANVPVTRAQVYADLVRVEQAGYSPAAGRRSENRGAKRRSCRKQYCG
jgi:hypothetical protein